MFEYDFLNDDPKDYTHNSWMERAGTKRQKETKKGESFDDPFGSVDMLGVILKFARQRFGKIWSNDRTRKSDYPT